MDENNKKNTSEQPSSKTNGIKGSLHPCHCPSCNGNLRDRKTIRRHFSSVDPYPKREVSSSEPLCVAGTSLGAECALGEFESFHVSGHHIEDATAAESSLFAGNTDGLSGDDSHEVTGDDDEIESLIESERTDGDISLLNNYSDQDIEKVILRCLESKVKNGWSQQETLLEIRNIYELIKDERIPHQSWDAVLKFLRKLDYEAPKNYKVCCGSNHVTLLEHQEDCPNCGKSWSCCINYYVLGIHLENYFLNENTIRDHLEHWENKDEWMEDDVQVKYKEIWHGERFKELAYFWDPSIESFLPVCCPNCETVISVAEMEASVLPGNTLHEQIYLSCSECMFDFVHKPKKMKGCPLNQAFIFHEDGFNAFEKKSRGISAIHISSACISKEKRTSGQYLRVYSFIPSVFLGEGIQHKMDAFFKPLVDEVKDLYINGINVNIGQQINLNNGVVIQPGNYQVRMLLLLGTADLKGHQEILLYAGGGRLGCRRCLVNGMYIPSKRHYYYGNFGLRFRHPSQPKTAQYYQYHGKRVDSVMSVSEHKRLQTESGVTGVSILFELHALYSFEPVQDMVIDRMHLTFNMLKREFIDQMWVDLGNNSDTPINARDPTVGGLINRDDFGSALNAIPWPKEERASGVARMKSLTDKLGSWKTNEFKKFSVVAREVLAEIVPSKAFDSYMLLCDAVQMLYSKELRVTGWSEENISRLHNLLWAHAIKAEEYYGLGFCTENLEYSVHAASEIRRHSSMDNYSCELYERAIRIHKKQKHNSKGLEKTFVERESLRDFLECYKQKNGPISSYMEGKPKYEFSLENVDNSSPFFLKESSFKSAAELLTELKGNQNIQIEQAVKFGVALGTVKYKEYPSVVISDIKRFFIREFGLKDQVIPNVLGTLKCVALYNQFGEIIKISKLDTVKIQSGNTTEEWIMEVKEIIQVGPVQGSYHTFINGKYFIPAFQNGHVTYHQWTNTPKFLPHVYNRDSVQPLTSFKRKVMIYPEPANKDNPSYFLCIDFKNPELIRSVKVPIYPEDGDTVKVKAPGHQEWYGKVKSVNLTERKARIQWYKETNRQPGGVWIALNEEDDVHFRSVIGFAVTTRTFGGITITDI